MAKKPPNHDLQSRPAQNGSKKKKAAKKKPGKKKTPKSDATEDSTNSATTQAPKTPVAATTAAEITPAPQLDLKEFVHQAWDILEPVTKLLWNWHLDLICEHLTLIQQNQFKNSHGDQIEGIIFNVPPRTMKSLLITVLFPAWVWTTDPARRFMFVSYSEKLSTQHSVYRRCVLESDWYRQNWGSVFTFAKDQNLKHHYENSRRGTMFSTGMQATATGMGGDVLVFDDPLNPEQAVSQVERESVNLRFDSTFRSRINNAATGVKIVIMQRLHEQDLTGHIMAKEADRWIHLRLPALAEREVKLEFPISKQRKTMHAGDLLWPNRLPQSFLDSQKIGMGTWAFTGQYLQDPAPSEGGVIKRQWIRFYRVLPDLDYTVQSWDCTFTGSDRSDYVAGQVWGRAGGKYYMLPHRVYDRLDFAPTMSAIRNTHALYPRANAILIENKANGPAIISELKKEMAGVVALSADHGKMSRAQAMSPLWEAGSVELPDPRTFDVPWIESYIHNICTFPKAAHDDDMDATSQAILYMRNFLVDGIIDFYRKESRAEQAAAKAHGSSPGGPASTAPGKPPLEEVFIPNSPATLAILEAVTNGHQIQCSARQYVEIRQTLVRAADLWGRDPKDVGRFLFVTTEMLRLDAMFPQPEPNTKSPTTF